MDIENLHNELSNILDNINPINGDEYDKSKYVRVRAWVVAKTEKALLLRGHHFKSRWIPLKCITQIPDTLREEYLGFSHAWLIEKKYFKK